MKSTAEKINLMPVHNCHPKLKSRRAFVGWMMLLIVSISGWNSSVDAQSYSLSKTWYATNGVAHLANTGNNRGVAYSAVSNQVFVATRAGATTGSIDVFDGTEGTLLSGSGGVVGANLGIDQIGAGDDGVLYGVPLNTGLTAATGNLTIYSWTNWNSTPYAAYVSASGDAAVADFTGKRIGDTMAVTGSGTNTLILMGIGAQGTNFLLFHTPDGTNFTPTAVFVPTGLAGTAGNIFGISFYTNGTFLVCPGVNASSHNVFLVSYPGNFASQPSVTGTVLGSAGTLTANLTTAINYSPAGQMLAVVQTASQSVNTNAIFSLINFPAGASSLATFNFPTPNANGNATGGAVLGGTNALYVLESNNGLQAYQVNFATVLPPAILSQPAGMTIYPPYTLSVSVSGTAPFGYQWLATNSAAAGSFTNISGATTNAYTITASLNTNYYEVIITNSAGSVTSSVVLVTTLNPVTNAAVSSLWTIPAGQSGYSFLPSSGDNTRGIAYDTNSQNVVVSASSGLYIINGNTGATNGTLSLSGATFGGAFSGPDQVGIADDGAVYAGNLTVNGQTGNYNLFRWATPTNGATITSGNASGSAVFAGDPGAVGGGSTGDRWGDYMAVRGAGVSTEILLASKSTNVALMVTADGTNFNSSVIGVPGVPGGFAAGGISFGAGNTFWAKSYLGDLWEISFDPVALTGTVVFDYKNPSQISSSMVGAGIDPVNNIYAGVNLSDNPNDLQLFQLTGTSDSPVLFSQSFFGPANVNGNENAVAVIKYPRAYALDVNNGVVAVTYGVPATTAPGINTQPANQTTFTGVPGVTFSVSASGSIPLYYQWQFNSNNIAGATSSSYTATNPSSSAAGYYDVVVHNISGSVTSAPALLTLITSITSTVVTQLWTVAPGSIPAINDFDGSTYSTRGLAYDTNTATVLLADHNNIYLLSATNGSYLGVFNMLGVPSGGLNGWLVDQIGVADDGVLYSCNLTTTGPGFSIVQWANIGVNQPGTAYAYPAASSSGGDPGNGSGDRWGDTMSVRGSGVNTEILIGSYTGTNVVLFTTTDGSSFTPTLIAVTNVPAGFSGLGIAFGAGNTFWADGGAGYNLRQVAFDPVGAVGGAVQTFTAGVQMPNSFTGLSLDVSNNILAGVSFSDSPNDMQLYLLSGNSNAPSLVNQSFFAADNANGQQNAVTVLKGGSGFGLDVNNGLVAISYGTLPAPGVILTSVAYAPGNVTINWNNVFNGHDYQVQYKNTLLDPSWTNLGSAVTTTNAVASFVDTAATGATRFYRVVTQ